MQITVLTYNIRHCRGINGKVSPPAVAGVIKRTGADVVGLQEVDRFNPRSGFVHQARRLAGLTGMGAVMGSNFYLPGLVGFGNAVLSRFPVVGSRNYPLPWRREKRGLLRAELCCGLQRIVFYTVHLGLDKGERWRQVERILGITVNDKLPLLLVGDFNARPGAPEIAALQKVFTAVDAAGVYPTFPAPAPQHKIDYIFFSAHWQLVDIAVLAGNASDHLPLVAKLRLNNKPV